MQQLELGLVQRPCPIHRERLAYQWTRQGLEETASGNTIVYGRWSTLFGCWRRRSGTEAGSETLPWWPVLDVRGVWLPPDEISALKNGRPSRRQDYAFPPDAAGHFAAYFSEIPANVRHLAAPFGDDQWAILDLCAQMPEFATFLEGELYHERGGWIRACLILMRNRSVSRNVRRDLTIAMMSEKRSRVLRKLTGADIPRVFLRLLERQDTWHLSFREVMRLIALCLDPDRRKVIAHAGVADDMLLDMLERVPDGFISSRLELLADDGVPPDLIIDGIRDAAAGLSEAERPAAIQAFNRVGDAEEFFRWCHRWTKKGYEARPFPASPVRNLPGFTAIGDYDDLKREARHMKNCVSDYLIDILLGDCYLLHWSGEEDATVMLKRDKETGWYLYEALGQDNEELSDASNAEISTAIQAGLTRPNLSP